MVAEALLGIGVRQQPLPGVDRAHGEVSNAADRRTSKAVLDAALGDSVHPQRVAVEVSNDIPEVGRWSIKDHALVGRVAESAPHLFASLRRNCCVVADRIHAFHVTTQLRVFLTGFRHQVSLTVLLASSYSAGAARNLIRMRNARGWVFGRSSYM